MLRASVAFGLVLAAAFLAVGPRVALAQSDDPRPVTQDFISPMGEPFRAHAGDPYPVEAWFKQADVGAKGYLTRADFQADALRFFKLLDKDGDGYLNDAEIDAYETAVAPEIVAAMGRDPTAVVAGPDKPRRGMNDEPPERRMRDASRLSSDEAAKAAPIPQRRGAGVFGFFDEPEPVRAADTNIDFRVSLREWQAAADKRFDALDLKHDGKIDRAELPMTPFQRALLRGK